MNNHQNQHGGNPYKKIEEVAAATAELAKVTGEKVSELFERTETLRGWHNEVADVINDNAALEDAIVDKVNEIADVVNRQQRQIRKLQQANSTKTAILVIGGISLFSIGMVLATGADEQDEKINQQDERILQLREEIEMLQAKVAHMREEQKKREMDG